MEQVFQKFNQSYLEVEAFEIKNALDEEEYWEAELDFRNRLAKAREEFKASAT